MGVRAYGLGELPGTSLIDAADVIIGETGDLVHLPQLPARGLSSDAVGRTAALLEAVHVDRGPRSWIMSRRPQLITRVARDQIQRDLDQCEEAWGTSLPGAKIQLLGPWSLAARVEMGNGHRVITDSGALRDLTEALILATLEHARDVEKRFGVQPIVQFDEPELPRVIGGELQGVTDFDLIPAVNAGDVAERLNLIIDAVQPNVLGTLLNQTGYVPNWEVARGCGADTVAVTLDQVRGGEQFDGFGEAITGGLRIGLGITESGDRIDALGERPRAKAVAVARFFGELGVDKQLLSSAVDVHPRGGLPEGKLIDAAGAYRMARAVADMFEADSGDL